jgi:endonuclease YncB( thermonuclease family)
VVILTLVAVLAAWLDPAPPPVSGAGRASDGDSFRLGAERIRLLGLDAPELDQSCVRAGQNWPCGRAARDRMAELLGSGDLDCQPQDRDQYGRLLARCTVGGEDLGAILVAQGWALSSGDYDREQNGARAAGKGIWSGSFVPPREWRDRQDRPRSGWNWLPFF